MKGDMSTTCSSHGFSGYSTWIVEHHYNEPLYSSRRLIRPHFRPFSFHKQKGFINRSPSRGLCTVYVLIRTEPQWSSKAVGFITHDFIKRRLMYNEPQYSPHQNEPFSKSQCFLCLVHETAQLKSLYNAELFSNIVFISMFETSWEIFKPIEDQ